MTVDTTRDRSARRRRRVLGFGALAVVALLAIGAPLFVRAVEDDLEARVPSELASAGFEGVVASFSGQDGVLTCEAPLDEPEDALDLAAEVRGVRRIELDRSCRVSRAPTVTGGDGSDTAGPIAVADFDSVRAVVDEDPRLRVFASVVLDTEAASRLSADGPITLFAPIDEAFDAWSADELASLRSDEEAIVRLVDHLTVPRSLTGAELVAVVDEDGFTRVPAVDGAELEIEVDDDQIFVEGVEVVGDEVIAANGVVQVTAAVVTPAGLLTPSTTDPTPAERGLVAQLDAGTITLSGSIADTGQRDLLVLAAESELAPASVSDRLVVEPDLAFDDSVVQAMAQLVAAMPRNLVSGTVVAHDDGTLVAEGVSVTDAAAGRFTDVAEAESADVTLEPRRSADDAAAAALQAELNGLVTAEPILFETGSARLSDESAAILDRLAGTAERLAGVTITIEGHTDSDGTQASNQALSEDRAQAVRFSLAIRGVPLGQLRAVGFGESEPIVVGGVEDKAASRRVEFRVEVTEDDEDDAVDAGDGEVDEDAGGTDS